MEATREEVNHVELLAQYLPEEQRQEFYEYVNGLMRNSAELEPCFLGFMEDYEDLAKIIGRHTLHEVPRMTNPVTFDTWDYAIYDIGCADALQHIFFTEAREYVGVDLSSEEYVPEPRFFRPNCRFVRGKFSELVKSGKLVITEKSFGIANMSLLYGGGKEDLELFNRLFLRKYII